MANVDDPKIEQGPFPSPFPIVGFFPFTGWSELVRVRDVTRGAD
jgi:hypothetical protein